MSLIYANSAIKSIIKPLYGKNSFISKDMAFYIFEALPSEESNLSFWTMMKGKKFPTKLHKRKQAIQYGVQPAV